VGPWPRDACTCASAWSRARTDAQTHLRGRGASVRLCHVSAGAGPRPQGPAPARTRFLLRSGVKPHPRVNADARGRPETSGWTFSSKNVLYVIPGQEWVSWDTPWFGITWCATQVQARTPYTMSRPPICIVLSHTSNPPLSPIAAERHV
jgi:hypothetical protein